MLPGEIECGDGNGHMAAGKGGAARFKVPINDGHQMKDGPRGNALGKRERIVRKPMLIDESGHFHEKRRRSGHGQAYEDEIAYVEDKGENGEIMPILLFVPKKKRQTNSPDHDVVREVAHIEKFAHHRIGNGGHEGNCGLKAENPLLDGNEKGIQVVVYKHEVQQLALAIHKRKKQKGIKMAEKRYDSVFRGPGVRIDEAVDDRHSGPVGQEKQRKAGNMASMKEKDEHPHQKQVSLHGEVTETVRTAHSPPQISHRKDHPGALAASGGLGAQEKASSLSVTVQQVTISLDPGSVEPIRVLHQRSKGGGFGHN
jgi:hypothetical protein